MRAAISITFLSLPAMIVAAPAPVYRSPITPELAAISQAADTHVRAAADLWKRFSNEGHSLTVEEKARLRDDHKRALRAAAEQYIRILHRVDRVKRPHPEARDLAAAAGRAAVKALVDAADHARAVRVYDRLTHIPTDPKARVDMMAMILCCRECLGQTDEVRKQLLLIGKEILKLDETDRDAWERWLVLAAKEIEK